MPQIAEIKEIDDQLWVRMKMEGDEGQVTLWTDKEIKEFKHACVRNFLIDLFNQWKDRS